MHTKKLNVILTAKQLFATKGYNNSSIQDIIEKSNISKGTFYNYFTSKNEFLIAYLNTAKEEEARRRNALIAHNEKTNKTIFVKQILIRIEIMEEFTLTPIHEATYHSDDEVFKAYLKMRFIDEITWLSTRIVHIYGEKSSAYANDCAILMYGMIQYMLFPYVNLTTKKMNHTLLVQYILRRMDRLIEDVTINEDVFFHEMEFTTFHQEKEAKSKQAIIENLHALKQSVNRDEVALRQHIDFLIEELHLEEPRIHLLRSFIYMVQKVSNHTKYEQNLAVITSQLEEFLD